MTPTTKIVLIAATISSLVTGAETLVAAKASSDERDDTVPTR